MVIENLKGVAPERKCFRLVGGVLVERTVKDVLPALASHRDQVRILPEATALQQPYWNHATGTCYHIM